MESHQEAAVAELGEAKQVRPRRVIGMSADMYTVWKHRPRENQTELAEWEQVGPGIWKRKLRAWSEGE